MKIDEQLAKVHSKPDENLKKRNSEENRLKEIHSTNYNTTSSSNNHSYHPDKINRFPNHYHHQQRSPEIINNRYFHSNRSEGGPSSSSSSINKAEMMMTTRTLTNYHHDSQGNSSFDNSPLRSESQKIRYPSYSSSRPQPIQSQSQQITSSSSYKDPFKYNNVNEDVRDGFGKLAEFATEIYNSGRIPTRNEFDSEIRTLTLLLEDVNTIPKEDIRIEEEFGNRFRYQTSDSMITMMMPEDEIERDRKRFKPLSPPQSRSFHEQQQQSSSSSLRPSTSMSAIPIDDQRNRSRLSTPNSYNHHHQQQHPQQQNHLRATSSSGDYRSDFYKSSSSSSSSTINTTTEPNHIIENRQKIDNRWPMHPAYGDKVIEQNQQQRQQQQRPSTVSSSFPSSNNSTIGKYSNYHETEEVIRPKTHHSGIPTTTTTTTTITTTKAITNNLRGSGVPPPPQLPMISRNDSRYLRRSTPPPTSSQVPFVEYNSGDKYGGSMDRDLYYENHQFNQDRPLMGLPSLPPPPISTSAPSSSSTTSSFNYSQHLDRRGSMEKGRIYDPRKYSPTENGNGIGFLRQNNNHPVQQQYDNSQINGGFQQGSVGGGGESSTSYISGDESLNGSLTGLRPSKYRKRSRAPAPGSCVSCHAKDTPEWRRGPKGARTLCNACGLHYSKLIRKKRKEESNDNAIISIEELRASLKLP